MYRLQPDAFERVTKVSVYDNTTTTNLVNALAAGGYYIAPPTTLTPGLTQVDTRVVCPVPFPLVNQTLRSVYTPVSFWKEVIQPLLSGPAASLHTYKPLIDWAKAAVTGCDDTTNGEPAVERALSDILTAFHMDRHLMDFHTSMIHQDFPAYGIKPVPPGDRVLAVAQAIRADVTAAHTAAAAHRATLTARKEPATIYPHGIRYMRRLAGLPEDGSRDTDLPPLIHELANVKASERRACIQARLRVRCDEPGAATRQAPIATKEMLLMIESGLAIAPTMFEIDELEKGLGPFTCSWRQGTPQGDAIFDRQENYDQQLAGSTQATLAEHKSLATKEIQFPKTSWEATQMLKSFSIVLDEVQGAAHPHALAFRVFLQGPWNDLVNSLEAMNEQDRNRIPLLWPRLIREMDIAIGTYLRGTLEGASPAIPTYSHIRDMVFQRKWNLIAVIPEKYLKEGEHTPTSDGNQGGAGAGGTGGSGRDPT